jgi:hypothetical protein
MMKGMIGYPNSASERAGWDRGKMLLDTFRQEIDNLVAGVFDLGRQVEAFLENMVRAIKERDAKLAGKELGVDALQGVRSRYRQQDHGAAGSAGPGRSGPQLLKIIHGGS